MKINKKIHSLSGFFYIFFLIKIFTISIVTALTTLKDFLKRILHKHEWDFYSESLEIRGREIKIKNRFCPKCGKKQIRISNKWFDTEMTKEEMRDFKLNQLL